MSGLSAGPAVGSSRGYLVHQQRRLCWGLIFAFLIPSDLGEPNGYHQAAMSADTGERALAKVHAHMNICSRSNFVPVDITYEIDRSIERER